MKKQVIRGTVERTARRTDFLFHNGAFKPKTVPCGKAFKRNAKHRKQEL